MLFLFFNFIFMYPIYEGTHMEFYQLSLVPVTVGARTADAVLHRSLSLGQIVFT